MHDAEWLMSYGSRFSNRSRSLIFNLVSRIDTTKGGTSETVLAYNMENGP